MAKKSIYAVHPSVRMVRDRIAALQEKTGRSLEEWIAVVKKSGPKTGRDRREWLKSEHGVGTNTATWIAERADGQGSEMDSPEAYLQAAERYVEEMFAAPKQGLRPVYEDLLRVAFAQGPDVKACPCPTIVPLYRNHVFAQIKPATRTRIDLGFALGARKQEGRLIDTGGYARKDRITQRIPIESVEEIDAEVTRWLRIAYESDE